VGIILVKFLVTVLPVLINVAFVTLLERKILGYTQLRLGPNKISFAGIFQPFRDAVKLFVKQFEINSNVN
jgi:NADH:ubiquinone oxidoreductase subunit H